jgi:hypothetical protein
MPDASRLLGAPTNLLEWLLATTGYQPRQAINHDGLPTATGYQPRRETAVIGEMAASSDGLFPSRQSLFAGR